MIFSKIVDFLEKQIKNKVENDDQENIKLWKSYRRKGNVSFRQQKVVRNILQKTDNLMA